MALSPEMIETLATRLENAYEKATAIPKITDEYPDLTIDEAFAIQYRLRERKIAQGHKIVGLKMGLTSWAKMKQMGVSSPSYAFLSDDYSVPEGAAVRCAELIHPRVEAEIAFVTKKTIQGPGCHIAAVLAATDYVIPALEIIDSRYENFRFDLPSVIADNASSARFVVGGISREVDGLDLKTIGVVLEKNGEIVETGAGAAVLGHPAASVAMLANMLAARGESIPEGCLILTGGITAAVAAKAGDTLTARYQGLGSVSVRFV